MTNERCRLISESQWREYQEFKADKRVLDEQISNLQSMVESECSKRCELENALSSQADYFRQRISVLEDRLKEAEGVVKAIHYGIEKGFTTCDCCGYENSCSDCYYNDVAKQYLEKYGVQK